MRTELSLKFREHRDRWTRRVSRVWPKYVARDLLAVGIFGANSRLGDRIEFLLRRGRTFSPCASSSRVTAGAAALSALMLAGSLAPRWIAFAQQQPRPTFAVASIKSNVSGVRGVTFAPMSGGRLNVENNPVMNLITNAYGVRANGIVGGPAWISSDRFDIEARADGSPDEAHLMLMLQALLEDRFKLKVHRETREVQVFNIIAAKGGIKLKPWQEGSCVTIDPFNPPPTAAPDAPRVIRCGNNLILPKGTGMQWLATKINMAGLAGALSAITRRPVIDKTGFAGNFDVRLEWTNAPDAADADSGPSFFTIVQDQLGLKLESAKGTSEVMVVDHVEKPDAN